MEQRQVLLVSTDQFDTWTYGTLFTLDGSKELSTRTVINYVVAYLKLGNGSLMYRCISVLKKLCTCSLKPTQASVETRCETISSTCVKNTE